MSSQREMVLELLKDGPLTSAEAMQEIGCYRLASRVNDLRKMGHKIKTEFINHTNRFGKTVKFASYELE